MEIIAKYIVYFFIYSFLGWIMEVCVSLIYKKRFVNRGFLIGPYCPIYGYGVIAIILLVGSCNNDVFAVFSKAVIISSVIEYATSYFMEKLFNIRWWDYSNKKFNMDGRISLETMVSFGVLSCLIIYFIHPSIVSFVDTFSTNTLYVLAVIIVIVYIVDNIISTHILIQIKDKIIEKGKDNTEKVKKYLFKWIEKNSYFYRRIKASFPKFQIRLNIKERDKKKCK